jgi:protein FAM161A
VPPEVKIPLFKLVMEEQEQRRQVLKTQFEALTKSLEKPFSFYIRDLAKPPPKTPEEPIHVFHANPVPWFVKIDRQTEFEQQEVLRKDRISKMARHTLSLAKMPARMEAAAKELKELKEMKEMNHNPRTQTHFKTNTFKAGPVPDFASLQEQFAKALLDKKKGYTPTVPAPFHFHEAQKTEDALKMLDFPDVAKENWAEKPRKKRPASAYARPKVVPATTQKMKDMVSAKQEYFERVKEKKQKIVLEEEARRAKHEMMKKAMKKAGTIKKFSLSSVYDEKVKARKQEMKKNEDEYKAKLQEITEKVANRPFLIDQVASSNLSRDIEGMGPVRRMLNQEYISEAVTSQEQEVSSESFG